MGEKWDLQGICKGIAWELERSNEIINLMKKQDFKKKNKKNNKGFQKKIKKDEWIILLFQIIFVLLQLHLPI